MFSPRSLLSPRVPQSRSNNGFTLIELLVVITIVAILAALLLPALSGVGDRGKTTACVGNLRQIAVGIFAYGNDHDGSIPPAVIQDGSGTNGANDLETILVSQKYLSAPTDASATALPGSSVFRCQGGLPAISTNNRAQFSKAAYASSDDAQGCRTLTYQSSDGKTTYYVHSWYGINAVVNNNAPPYPFWCPQSNPTSVPPLLVSARKITSLSNLNKIVGVYCGVGFHNGAIARVAARHNRRKSVNVMFMDGHVATLPIADVQAAYMEAAAGTAYAQRVYKDLSFSTNFD